MFEFFQILFNATMVSTTVYAWANYRKTGTPLRLISYQLLITSAGELYGLYSLKVLREPAFAVYHFLTPIEYALYALFFYTLTEKAFTKLFILITIVVLTLFSIGNSLWVQPLTEFNSNAYLAGSALMVVFALLYYIELYQREDFYVPIVQMPDFWIVTGIFFLYAGSFFVTGLTRIITAIEPETAPKLYIINLFLNILLYVLVFYGFRCATRVKT